MLVEADPLDVGHLEQPRADRHDLLEGQPALVRDGGE